MAEPIRGLRPTPEDVLVVGHMLADTIEDDETLDALCAALMALGGTAALVGDSINRSV